MADPASHTAQLAAANAAIGELLALMDAERALLHECRSVLDDYRSTFVDLGDGISEGYPNDDVIELCERLDVFFAVGGGAGQ